MKVVESLEIKDRPSVMAAWERGRRLAQRLGLSRANQTCLGGTLYSLADILLRRAGGGTCVFSADSGEGAIIVEARLEGRGPEFGRMAAAVAAGAAPACGLASELLAAKLLVDVFEVLPGDLGAAIRIAMVQVKPSRPAAARSAPEAALKSLCT